MTDNPRVLAAAEKARDALLTMMSETIREDWDPDHSGPEDICEDYIAWLMFSAENMAKQWPALLERDVASRSRP